MDWLEQLPFEVRRARGQPRWNPPHQRNQKNRANCTSISLDGAFPVWTELVALQLLPDSSLWQRLLPIKSCACFMDGTSASKRAARRRLGPYSCHINKALCLPVPWCCTPSPPPSLSRKNRRTSAESTFWPIFSEICPLFLCIVTHPSPSKNPTKYSSSSWDGSCLDGSTVLSGSW